MISDYSVKKAVSDFRAKNGLSPKEPVDLYSLLLKLRILTIFKPLSDSFSGMVGQVGEDIRFLIVNANQTIGRQNFTICHELFHLFYDIQFNNFVCDLRADKKNRVERDADIFAANLLMPEEGIIDLIPDSELGKNKITSSTLLIIESSYKCSRSALLGRLKELKLIGEEKYKLYGHNVISEVDLLGFDRSLYLEGNDGKVIGDYSIIAKKLYDEEHISESSFTGFLRDIGIRNSDEPEAFK